MAALIYAKINKETLRFIRSTKQVSFNYIQRIAKIAEDKVALWENVASDKLPTINQAKTLAKHYRVLFAGFYMNSEDINTKHLPRFVNKRTIPGGLEDNSAVNLALFDLINDRELYLETKKVLKEMVPTFSLQISDSYSAAEWARIIREYFDISLAEQYKKKSTRQFYLYLRGKIEAKGIFIQGFQKVDTTVLRGVAIFDDSMPIIGINDDDRYPAKSFSIIHELVHIIKRSSSICNDMFGSNPWDSEEVFCNAVAGEALVPQIALFTVARGGIDFSIDDVDAVACKFSVSSEVVARRLLDTGKCGKQWYDQMNFELARRFQTERENLKNEVKMGLRSVPKRNMSREAIDRTSSSLCNALLKGYSEGIFDKADISAHIGIGQKYINKFVTEVMGWYL